MKWFWDIYNLVSILNKNLVNIEYDSVCVCVCIYIYIYIYTYTHPEDAMDKLLSKLHKNKKTIVSHFMRYIHQNFMKISWNNLD